MSSSLQERDEDLHAELGYRTTGQREVRQREWFSLQGETGEPAPTPRAFRRLVWNLRAKRYWANKPADRKARIYAYRRQWAKDNAERYRNSVNACRRKRRADPKVWAAELAAKRAARLARKKANAPVFTCGWCGAQWCVVGRIPCRKPKWCSVACRGRALWADPERRTRELAARKRRRKAKQAARRRA